MALLMLTGVAVFSFVMGNFIEILHKIQNMNNPLEEGSLLSKFFGLLVRFNRNQHMNLTFKKEIEDYFEYRWNNNKNWLVYTEEDRSLLQ